jgi:hypothetical protein
MTKHCQHKPKDSPDTQKKLQVAGTSRDDAILILRGLNFHDAFCRISECNRMNAKAEKGTVYTTQFRTECTHIIS